MASKSDPLLPSALHLEVGVCPPDSVVAPAVSIESRQQVDRAPNVTVTLEPMEGGKGVFLPLAPPFQGGTAQVKIVLACLIRNNETSSLQLRGVTFSFPGSNVAVKVMQGAHIVTPAIEPGQQRWWSNGVVTLSEDNKIDNAVYLNAPAPPRVKVALTFDGYNRPIELTADLAPHKAPAPQGGWLFPFSASDLRIGEYFRASARHWANGGGAGRQILAHDIGCVAWDAEAGKFTSLLPGKDGGKNEHYRIYGKPVRALDDGTVLSFHDGEPANTPGGFPEPTPDPVAGNHLWIDHGTEKVLYTHLQKDSIPSALKHAGAPVTAGQMVGRAGNTGNSSAPHEHCETAREGNNSLRPLPFRDAWICQESKITAPSPDGPWVRLDAEGVPFDAVLIWPASSRPAWYPPGWSEVSHHAIPESAYQTIFNRASQAGYRPVWLDGYEVAGQTLFNAIFRPSAGAPPWVARHNMTGANYQLEFEQQSSNGFRLINLTSYLHGGQIRYAAIWEKRAGPGLVAYHGLSAQEHQARVDTLGPQGFRPVNVSVVSPNGSRSYAAFWEKKDVGTWELRTFLTAEEYQAKWNENTQAGRRVAYLSAYNHLGDVRFSAAFQSKELDGNDASTKGRHGLTSEQYQNEFDDSLAAGDLTRCVTGYAAGLSARFAAIWRKP